MIIDDNVAFIFDCVGIVSTIISIVAAVIAFKNAKKARLLKKHINYTKAIVLADELNLAISSFENLSNPFFTKNKNINKEICSFHNIVNAKIFEILSLVDSKTHQYVNEILNEKIKVSIFLGELIKGKYTIGNILNFDDNKIYDMRSSINNVIVYLKKELEKTESKLN